jgi:hypothetical protein
MHTRANRCNSIYVLSVLMLVAAACSPAATGTSGAPSGPAGTPPPEEVPLPQDITWGSGSFTLGDPAVGLPDLASYTASLTRSFEGTKGGQPYRWSKAYSLLVRHDPPAREMSLDKTGDLTDLTALRAAELDGVRYDWQGTGTCTGLPIEDAQAMTGPLELAGFLGAVLGAEEAGTATTNSIPTSHYTFDQHALGLQDLTQSTGELWVASEGGYLVKYLLTSKGGPDYFGEGLEGTLTEDYELNSVGAQVDIQLPQDCPAGMVDAPLLEDAANIERSPGAITYDSASSIKDASAFYEKELAKLGWSEQEDTTVAEDTAAMHFQLGDKDLSLLIGREGETTSVTVLLSRVQK